MWRVAGLAIVLTCTGQYAAAGEQATPAALAAAAFANPPVHGDDASGGLINHTTFGADAAPADWRSGEVRLSHNAGAVDTLRVSLAEPVLAGGRPLRLPGDPQFADAYEVSLIRNWPGAVSFETRRFGLDLSPHAGVGMTSAGGLAEAGATIRLSQRLDEAAVQRLKALGVRDGASFGGRGRWYLFAAASGRAVGLNMLRGEGGWNRAGWTTDPTSTLVGDAQVGVGWRKGSLQTSVGFVHREVKGLHMIYGQESKADSLVAFSFSVKPRK
ncbi:MAG: hypothetical protein JWP50_1884 [Phenylobacterium sp.]|nr:hypothetical protein [Phenylobacterium sp.]